MGVDAASPALAATPLATPSLADAAQQKTLREFEAVFLGEMLKPLFAGAAGLAGDGPEAGAYGDMLRSAYAEAIAARGGLGVANAVGRALITLQANDYAPNALASSTEQAR